MARRRAETSSYTTPSRQLPNPSRSPALVPMTTHPGGTGMNRVLMAVAAAAALPALTVPLATADHRPGHDKPPKGTGNLTLRAAPNPVLFGRSVTITGDLRGGDVAGK